MRVTPAVASIIGKPRRCVKQTDKWVNEVFDPKQEQWWAFAPLPTRKGYPLQPEKVKRNSTGGRLCSGP